MSRRPATPEEIAEYQAGNPTGPVRRPATPEEVAEFKKTQPPAAAPETSLAKAGLMGAGNAASFGANDEVGGFLGALGDKLGFNSQPEIVRAQTREGAPIKNAAADAQEAESFGDKYRGYRDEIRRVDAVASKEHPIAYHGAGIAASVANPVGNVARGTNFFGRLGNAAKVGAATGFGNSEADLTKGDLGDAAFGAAKDTALGAGLGVAGEAVAEGVGRGVKSIANRNVEAVGERILNEAAEGTGKSATTATARKKLARAEDPIRDLVVNDPRVRPALSAPPAKGREMLAPLIGEAQATREAAYKAIEDAGGGMVDVPSYMQKLKVAADEARAAGHGQVVKAIDAYASGVAEFADGKPLTLQQLRGLTTEAQGRAASVLGGLNEHQMARITAKVEGVATGAMDETLSESVEAAISQMANTGGVIDQALATAADTIRKNNKKFQAVLTLDDALKQRAYKESTGKGFFERLGGTAARGATGGALGYVAAGDDGDRLTSALLGATAVAALPKAGRAIDRGVTSASINALRGGSITVPALGKAVAPAFMRLGRNRKDEEKR